MIFNFIEAIIVKLNFFFLKKSNEECVKLVNKVLYTHAHHPTPHPPPPPPPFQLEVYKQETQCCIKCLPTVPSMAPSQSLLEPEHCQFSLVNALYEHHFTRPAPA
jgi:hypothetical protein